MHFREPPSARAGRARFTMLLLLNSQGRFPPVLGESPVRAHPPTPPPPPPGPRPRHTLSHTITRARAHFNAHFNEPRGPAVQGAKGGRGGRERGRAGPCQGAKVVREAGKGGRRDRGQPEEQKEAGRVGQAGRKNCRAERRVEAGLGQPEDYKQAASLTCATQNSGGGSRGAKRTSGACGTNPRRSRPPSPRLRARQSIHRCTHASSHTAIQVQMQPRLSVSKQQAQKRGTMRW